MIVPKGYTEAQVLAIIEQVVHMLARAFRFGVLYDTEDMAQQARLFAVEALQTEKYDDTRPLDSYIFISVRNRLINLRRDKYNRYETPCVRCIFYSKDNSNSPWKNQCAMFENKPECEKYGAWLKRNETKRGINNPKELSVINECADPLENTVDIVDNISHNEILGRIDARLSVDLRNDFMRLLHNASVPKARRLKVQEAIREILGEEYMAEFFGGENDD